MITATDAPGGGPAVTRRRALTLLAATAAVALPSPLAARAPAPTRWRGTVLGAHAQLLLYGAEPGEGRRLVALILSEVKRLERIFSLYSANSLLVGLNRAGRVENPPMELVSLLERARFWSEWSGGAFDVTLQPLWALYRDHFAATGANPAGPSAQSVQAALRLVDYRALEIETHRIAFSRPGMAVTLNGIAQGFITDRVAELLRGEGMTQVMIDMGEVRALGSAPGPKPWRVGLARPDSSEGLWRVLEIVDRAVATSAPAGTRFEPTGRFHHLLDPRTGRPAYGIDSLTVVAKNATDADALSTALLVKGIDRQAPEGLPATIERIFVDGAEVVRSGQA